MHTCLITLTLDNQKRFWSLVKRLRKNFDEPVATLYADYNLKTTLVSKTEALNQQFYSVFTRPGLSCQTQPVLLVDKILKAMDSHHQVARSAATQFFQASNTVAHNKLLLKLAHYDIQSNTHQWIATWLTTRTQNVIVEGERSKDKRVLSGVPQRTVLGPLMILLYINVIDRDICSLIRLFTDDYILYWIIETPKDHQHLQCDLNSLIHWTRQWQMKLNQEKCVTLRCTRPPTPYQATYSLLINPCKL